MASEPNLRDLFGEPTAGANAIDVESVVRRSRARRTPRIAGIGAACVLAFGGITFAGFQGLSGQDQVTSATDSSAGSEPMMEAAPGDAAMDEGQVLDEGTKRAPAERLNLCGGPLAEVAPSETGLVLTAAFPDAAAGAASVEGTVTMTNTGGQTWRGYTAASPAITLSQGGIVLWHSNGPMIQLAREIALAPGESAQYDAFFTPVKCEVEDDAADSFREDLPPVPAGEYQVSAAIDFMGELDAELVTGPAQTIILH